MLDNGKQMIIIVLVLYIKRKETLRLKYTVIIFTLKFIVHSFNRNSKNTLQSNTF